MNLESRAGFLTFTGAFLFTLLSTTLIAAHWLEIPLVTQVRWTLQDFGIGVGAAGVMFLSFRWLTSLRKQAGDAIGASLAQCYWYDLAIMAVLVGIVEEFMFRGLLEQWIATWNPIAGFFLANIVFGLLHAISPLYAFLAAVLGGVLSLLTWYVGEFNLLRPIVAHAVYDFIGFMVIAADYRSPKADGSASMGDSK